MVNRYNLTFRFIIDGDCWLQPTLRDSILAILINVVRNRSPFISLKLDLFLLFLMMLNTGSLLRLPFHSLTLTLLDSSLNQLDIWICLSNFNLIFLSRSKILRKSSQNIITTTSSFRYILTVCLVWDCFTLRNLTFNVKNLWLLNCSSFYNWESSRLNFISLSISNMIIFYS
jgi:hypothetical protein